MNSANLYEKVFNVLKQSSAISNLAIVAISHPSNSNLNKGQVVVSLKNDSSAGKYLSPVIVNPDIQVVCYHPEFSKIQGFNQLHYQVKKVIETHNDFGFNFNRVREFYPVYVEKLALWQSSIVYRFYTQENL